jgi:hypothetical protein
MERYVQEASNPLKMVIFNKKQGKYALYFTIIMYESKQHPNHDLFFLVLYVLGPLEKNRQSAPLYG